MGIYRPVIKDVAWQRNEMSRLRRENESADRRAISAAATSEWSTGPITIASGFDTGSGSGLKRQGAMVFLRYNVLRNGATLTATATGSLETTVLTVSTNLRPTATTIVGNFEVGTNGTHAGTLKLLTNGQLVLSTLYPSQTIVDNAPIALGASWMLG